MSDLPLNSVYTDTASSSRLARRLSVLPTLVGLAGLAIMAVGAVAAGLTDGERGWTWVLVSVSLALATVLIGSAVGLYGGLGVLAVAGLTVGDAPTLAELIALTVTLFLTNETVRFSLDARRPSRFGPGLVGGYLARTAASVVAIVAMTVCGWAATSPDPGPTLWVPIAMAVAGLPLFCRWLAEKLDERDLVEPTIVRAGLAAAVTIGVLMLVVVGAQARSAVESTGPITASTPAVVTTTTTTLVTPELETSPESVRRSVVLAVVLTLLLALGVLYLALRRPEAVFELDELDADLDDSSFGLAIPERVEQESEAIEVDEDDLKKLLADLHLDIASERDPGRAVRFGYTNIEQRLAELGITRGDAETERELLARAIPDLGAAGDALTALTKLFERARFSQTEVDEGVRLEALAAVDRLLAEVDRLVGDAGPATGQGRR